MRHVVPLLASFCALLVSRGARADGFFIPPFVPDKPGYSVKSLGEPEQEAVITFDGTRETMTLRVAYEGPADRFAWIVPTPAQPEVSLEKGDPFAECERLILDLMTARYKHYKKLAEEEEKKAREQGRPLDADGETRTVGMPRPVKVLQSKCLGDYEICVLQSDDAAALGTWAKANGFLLPEHAAAVLDPYVQEKWTFTAVKIRNGVTRATLNPLRFSFDADAPVFPLKISSLNAGATRVTLYLWTFPAKPLPSPSSYVVMDQMESVGFSPDIRSSKDWKFHEGDDPAVEADLATLASRCPKVREAAPAFFKTSEVCGARLTKHTSLLTGPLMLTDLRFDGHGNQDLDCLDPLKPEGISFLRDLCVLARDPQPELRRNAIRYLAMFGRSDPCGVRLQERLKSEERKLFLSLANDILDPRKKSNSPYSNANYATSGSAHVVRELLDGDGLGGKNMLPDSIIQEFRRNVSEYRETPDSGQGRDLPASTAIRLKSQRLLALTRGRWVRELETFKKNYPNHPQALKVDSYFAEIHRAILPVCVDCQDLLSKHAKDPRVSRKLDEELLKLFRAYGDMLKNCSDADLDARIHGQIGSAVSLLDAWLQDYDYESEGEQQNSRVWQRLHSVLSQPDRFGIPPEVAARWNPLLERILCHRAAR